MALSTAKLTELPPHILSTLSLHRRKPPHFSLFSFKPFTSSLRSTKLPKTPSKNPNIPETPSSNSSSWIKKWPSPPPAKARSRKPEPKPKPEPVQTGPGTTTAMDRIVLRLRNLGLGSDDEDEEFEDGELGINLDGSDDGTGLKDEKLGDLLKRDWVRPDTILAEDDGDDEEVDTLLPWERGASEGEEETEEGGGTVVRKRVMRAPSMADLTIEDEELRRLRRMGMTLRERVNVPKAGVTGAVLEKIHDKWRKCELVRLKFHEELAHDMRTAHEIVEVGEW